MSRRIIYSLDEQSQVSVGVFVSVTNGVNDGQRNLHMMLTKMLLQATHAVKWSEQMHHLHQ